MKILVGASGSRDGFADPIAATASFPWPGGSEIQVLTVSEVIQPAMAGVFPGAASPVLDVGDVQLRADTAAETIAANAVAQFQSRGFRAEGVTLEGDPQTAIADYARTWGADVIVVGTHDRSRVEKLLLGSVSESVVKHSPCSVLVVKHRGE
jgi:nucleotide-binding universal stress UspA family protein